VGTHYIDHTVVSKPDCDWYEPQVIDGIMSKPGKVTVLINQNIFPSNRVFISEKALQLVVSEFNT